jgi:hypothetical protein
MRMLEGVTLFDANVSESKTAKKYSVGLSNWHTIYLFNGEPFSFFLHILDRFINELIGFLNVD